MFNNLGGNLRKTINKYLGNSLPSSALWGWLMPGEWTKNDLIAQYSRVTYAVVSAIAEDSAKVAFLVRKGESALLKHPFYDFMKMPNPMMSQFQFLEMHFTLMKIYGESYWYLVKGKKTRLPKEAYLLRPEMMAVAVDKKDPRGLVSGYVLTKPDGTKETFKTDEILHFKMPNPANPYYGMGTIQAAKTYIQTEQSASEWTRNSLFNSGRPSGILNLKGIIGAEEFKAIKRQFKEEYTGSKNAGKTMLTKGADGIDYQKLGMELGEVALKELKDMTRDDIMMMFRVSKTMIGISDDVNRANAQENHAVFIENVIKPEIDRMVDHLTAFLMPVYGEGLTLEYVDPDLQSDADRLAEWTAGHNKWLTTNDIRDQRDLKPIEGGDVIYQSIGLVPLTKESEVPREPEDDEDEDDGGEDDKKDDKKDDKEDDDNDGDKSVSRTNSKTVRKQKKKELTKADVFKTITIEHQDLWIRKYKEFVNQEFELQLKEILSKHNKASLPEWTFDILVSKARLEGIFIPLGITLMQEASKYAFELVDDTDTELLINERIKEYVGDRVERFAVDTNNRTIKSLEATLVEGIKDGENLTKLRNRVKEVYTNATNVRSLRIARTEALAASNEGALEAYRQSPVVTGKEWSANFGACEFCEILNGKVVELDQDYLQIGETLTGRDGGIITINYEDVGHPPAHPNCRCALLPYIAS